MRLDPPIGESNQRWPTVKVPVGLAAPCDGLGHVAAENLGKTDAVLDPLRGKWLSLAFGLDHCTVNASYHLRGSVATTRGQKR